MVSRTPAISVTQGNVSGTESSLSWGGREIWCDVSLAQALGKWKRVEMIGCAEILRCAQDDRFWESGGENLDTWRSLRFQMRLEAHDEESVVLATQKEQVQKHSSFRGNFIAWRRSEEKPLFLLDH